MHIMINDNTSFKEIQKAFADFYPYLQLEFYTKKHEKYEESFDIDLVYPGKSVHDLKNTHVFGILEIKPLDKVADVENELKVRFGLSAQVFWKDKDVWRQTTGMDDLTLKELNELGRNSSDEFVLSDDEDDLEENL